VSARLEALLGATRARLEERKRERPLEDLERAAGEGEQRPFSEALSRPGTSLVAEYKRRSPSAGALGEGLELEDVVTAYERGGAAALSVLTDEDHFGGSLGDVRAARSACGLPILRKDFTVDPYQLYEARAAGADAVLLVVRSLPPPDLQTLYSEARGLDLDALVEVNSEPELELALEVGADVIGINNRDLDDFSVDLRRTFELLPEVPAGKVVVSESGIAARPDVDELERVGVDAVLVGEALMRAPDPESAVRDLVRSEDTREHDAVRP
jgi:indole-3-glycerol phosphate synthase